MLEQARLENSLAYYSGRERDISGVERIVGTSPAIVEVKRRLRFLVQAEAKASPDGAEPGPPVLILGETGTGKELVARALHFDGPRAAHPFVSVNCAALPEQLVESELFGHEKGAFTGATEKKIGLFQSADGGTLFLDEIGELPLAQQGKLLRALEERMIRPVGALRDRPVNVRFVAATNAAIEERARAGEFRADLLYRLNTITLAIPPLRHRGEDIVRIAESFAAEFGRRYGRERLSFTPAARQALLHHPWPGNIRELRNTIEQAALLCARDAIDVSDLALRDLPSLGAPAALVPGATDDGKLVEAEKTLIISALRQHAGNVTLAARALGISRDTLRYRMEKHALRRDYYTS
jgi:DNA-binding NtrC family response regulator